MSEMISADEMERLLSACALSRRDALREALRRRTAPPSTTGPILKSNLRDIYSVRLRAYLDGAGPELDGVEEFLAALDPPGSVGLVTVETTEKIWFASLEGGALTAIFSVGRENREGNKPRDKMQGIREFFTRYQSAGIVLPGGWHGRPGESYFELRSMRESFEYLTIEFDLSTTLSIIRPRGMLIVHSKSPKIVIEKCGGGVLSWPASHQERTATEVFTEGPVELHAPPRVIAGVAWSDQSDEEEVDDQFR